MQIHDGWLIVSADAPLNAHNGFQEVMGRGKHWRNTSSMDEALQAEGEDDNSDNSHSHCLKWKVKSKTVMVDDGNFFSSLQVEGASDADDDDFSEGSSSDSGTDTSSGCSEHDSDIQEITNEEVHNLHLLKWHESD
jgi:hypothetical protein